jgi:hypothetical protein
MPTSDDATLRSLRLKYNAANAAYQECVKARTEATMSGAVLSPSQLEKEIAALRTLNEVRDTLLAGMAPKS